MSYEILFYAGAAFILGRLSVGFKIYVGPDRAKYDAATIGILTK